MKQYDSDIIKQIISEKYGWGQTADWTNFHFKTLSNDIEATTGDRISEETLKRIFGKRKVSSDNYNPQAFSQMALLKFAEAIRRNDQPQEVSPGKATGLFQKLLTVKNWVWIAAAILLTVLLAILLFSSDYKYRFSCVNPRDFAPYTATFSYDVSEIDDSVFTDFGIQEETFLPPEKTMINCFYPHSGDYTVRFYTRKKLLDSLRVIAWSRDWQAGWFPNTKPELFKLFKNQQFYRKEQSFYATANELHAEGADIDSRIWTEYQYLADFKQSLDGLSLETRVLNNAKTGSLSCYDAEIKLLGDSGMIDFKFTQTKCSRYASVRVSEKFLDGKFTDLSAFTVDMSDWLEIKMHTHADTCKIYLDKKLIFSQKYEKPLGSLVGIIYQFYGSGMIDMLNFKDAEGKVFYQHDFGGADQISTPNQ